MAKKKLVINIGFVVEVENADDIPSVEFTSRELMRLFRDYEDEHFSADLVRHSFVEVAKDMLRGAVIEEFITNNGWQKGVAYSTADKWMRQASVKLENDAHNLSVTEIK